MAPFLLGRHRPPVPLSLAHQHENAICIRKHSRPNSHRPILRVGNFPDEAKRLHKKLEEEYKERYATYRRAWQMPNNTTTQVHHTTRERERRKSLPFSKELLA